MADNIPPKDIFDKLQAPQPDDKQVSSLKLTLQSIQTTVEKMIEKSKKSGDQSTQTLNALIKKGEESLKTDSDIMDYLTRFAEHQKTTNDKHQDKVYEETDEIQDELDTNDEFAALEKKQLDKKIETTIKTNNDANNKLSKDIGTLSTASLKNTTQAISTSRTFFGKTWDGIKKYGTGLYSGAKSVGRFIGHGSFCSFFDNTLGKAFRVFKSHGPTLGLFLSSASIIWSGLTLISNSVIWVVEKLWDGFKALAKIGWAVISGIFNVITAPIISVGKWFVEQLVDFASSPIGFLLVVAGITVAAYIGAVFWKPIINFIGTVATMAWDWVSKQVKSWLGPDNVKALKSTFLEKKDQLVGYISDVYTFITAPEGLTKFYDDYIGTKIGFTSENIKNLWTEGVDFLKRGFNVFVNIFTSIKNDNLFDELLVVWAVLKQIVVGKETYRNELVAGENNTRAYAGLRQSIQNEAEAYVQSHILEEVFNNYNGIIDDRNKDALVSYGRQQLEFFINSRKFSNDALGKKILSGIFISVESIVNNFSKESIRTLKNLRYEKSDEFIASQQISSNILDIIQSPAFKDIAQTEKVSFRLDNSLSKLAHDSLISNITMSNLGRDFIPPSLVGVQLALQTNRLNTLNGTMLSISKNSNRNSLEDLNKQLLTLYHTVSSNEPQRMFKIILSAIFNKNYDEIQKNINTLFSSVRKTLSPFDVFGLLGKKEVKEASGGVVTGPVHALVGEAGYPEIVIPINKEGMDFVNSSMGIVSTGMEMPEMKKNYKNNIIGRLSKSAQKTDYTLYDMKNLSTGSVGVE